jgi:choline dehydrogenase-like flavoprotein
MKHIFSILTAILFIPLATGYAAEKSHVEKSDVIVYGSTPGGFCAAIAAAREGASVILLEPTQHVGGLSTGGLSHCDSNQMRRETLLGLFDEWHTRIVKDYTDRGLPAPYDPKLKNQALWTFEPHVAMRVTKAMLKEAGVMVHTDRYLKSVTMEGPRITLSQKDIIDSPEKEDAIAISSFPIDSHDCQRVALNHGLPCSTPCGLRERQTLPELMDCSVRFNGWETLFRLQ